MLKRLWIIFILIFFTFFGCTKKQKTPIGKVPVPDLSKPIDLLPSVINVRYNQGSSGVDSCKTCHQEYFSEWRKSAHAKATESEIFKVSSDHYQLESCMTCHSPRDAELSKERPEARNFRYEEGVTCSACHVVSNATLGVLNSNAPHKTRFTKDFATSLACASCHQGTYNEWENSKFFQEKRQCQSCHMPEIERYIANYAKIGYKKKTAHDHSFQIEYAGSLSMDIQVSKLAKEQITLAATNIGSGHDLPTGIFGNSTLTIDFMILDADKQIFFRQEVLSQNDKNAIKAGETRRFFYNFRAPQKKSYLIQAKAFLSSASLKEPIKLFEKEKYYLDD